MKSRINNIHVFLYLIVLTYLSNVLSTNPQLDTLVKKYEAIVEGIEMDNDNNMIAKTEIFTNKQILIIPSSNIMSSEEEYQFKGYFSKNNKEKLVGRLLIERFIGNESYYYNYIEYLPKLEDLNDYYHYTDKHKEEFNRRSLIRYNWQDRKSEYEALVRKIPSNVDYYLIFSGNSFSSVELGSI